MVYTYILKAGVAGVQTSQTIWNFPQKDCLRTRKLSIWVPKNNRFWNLSQIKVKFCRKASNLTCSCFQIFWNFVFKSYIFRIWFIYTLFFKFCCRDLRVFSLIFFDCKAKFADFYAFRMYGSKHMLCIQYRENLKMFDLFEKKSIFNVLFFEMTQFQSKAC